MDKQTAFNIVFQDMQKCNMFQGIYDAKNGDPHFMYGVSTVMEYIASQVSDDALEDFSKTFMSNMLASVNKANQKEMSQKKNYVITLPITKQWYDMILSGEKTEEYREIKPYYTTRFTRIFRDFFNMPMAKSKSQDLNEWLQTGSRFQFPERFSNGYQKNSPSFVAYCLLSVGKGRPEWGAEPGRQYYVLQILKILS